MMANDRAMTVSFFRTAYPWIIVCCGMLFYCYNYFLRVSPSVMQGELTHAFHITATQFGTLAGLYYWAYTPMQVPAGILYDKFGVRFVLSVACLIAVVGLSIFIAAHNYSFASMGRFFIGLGCAFAYIGTLKLASIWLAPNRFATVAGLATAIGMASGALSQKYLAKIVDVIGYQEALRSALISGVILSVIILLLVRSRPKHKTSDESEMRTPIDLSQLFTSIRLIFANPQMWLIGIIGCLLYLPSSVFLDLWGIPYLKEAHHLTPEQAVAISSYTFYGWIIGGPVLGALSDKIKRRRMPLTLTGIVAAILLCVIFYIPGVSLDALYIMFFLIGFCCGSHSLCFALGKESNPIQISGTAVAITNMLIMAGGAVFQPLVGKLLDLHSLSAGPNGLPIYTSSDYTFALSVVPIGMALGVALTFFLKETYCESQAKEAEKLIYKPAILRQPEAEPIK